MVDGVLYEYVYLNEIESGNLEYGLWAKALAKALWNHRKAKAIYIEDRVTYIKSKLLQYNIDYSILKKNDLQEMIQNNFLEYETQKSLVQEQISTSNRSKLSNNTPFIQYHFNNNARVGSKEFLFRTLLPYISVTFFIFTFYSLSDISFYTIHSMGLLSSLFIIFTYGALFPTIKRLHDFGASSLFALLLIFSFANILFLTLLVFIRGEQNENKFGQISNEYVLGFKDYFLLVLELVIIMSAIISFLSSIDFSTLQSSNLQKSTQKEAKNQENTNVKLYKFTINTLPENAEITFLEHDIKYLNNMNLQEGIYKIKIKKEGYISQVKTIHLLSPAVIEIKLKKESIEDQSGNLYEEVISPFTQKIWLDRNLGAKQVCENIDQQSCFGDYYTLDTKTSKDNTKIKILKKESNPCPRGFRIPSIEELAQESFHRSLFDNKKLYQSFLKIPSSGYYLDEEKQFVEQGSAGVLLSNELEKKLFLGFTKDDVSIYFGTSADSYTIRCIKTNNN